MRRSAGTDAPWYIRLLRRVEERFWEHWATNAEYRRRFGNCLHPRRRNPRWAEQDEPLFVAWLFMALQWLVYARITGQ